MAKKTWDSAIIKGLSNLVDGDVYKSVYNLILDIEKENSNHVILSFEDTTYTYSEILYLTHCFAAYLKKELKVGLGIKVGVILYNSIEFCIAYLASNMLGAIFIPYPTKYKDDELLELIDKSQPDVLLIDPDYPNVFKTIQADCNAQYLNTDIFNKLIKRNRLSKRLQEEVVSYRRDFAKNPSLIIYTSGTTGRSKGALIKNSNIIHASIAYQKIFNLSKKDSSVIGTPMYNITGLVGILTVCLYSKCTLYVRKFFKAPEIVEIIAKEKITYFHGAPTTLILMIKELEKYPQIPSMRIIGCGSSNMPVKKIKELKKHYPNLDFRTIYGLTETTSPGCVMNVDASSSEYIGSSGIPIPGNEILIANENGDKLLPGEVGEIYIKGATVIDEYYEAETDCIDEGGWLHTGDLGYVNEDGFLYVVDRIKDMINRGGEKVTTFEIENEIYKIDGIIEVAVVGIRDDTYGEVPAAMIKKDINSLLTEDDIKKKLSKVMAKYKIPEHIKFIESIPKTSNGKIDKVKIKRLFTKQR